MRVVGVVDVGLVVKPLGTKRARLIAYDEILTAERIPRQRGLRLHVRTGKPIRLGWRRTIEIEGELRRRHVRIVDRWGAIIAPSLADFEAELANEPATVRQSSDNA